MPKTKMKYNSGTLIWDETDKEFGVIIDTGAITYQTYWNDSGDVRMFHKDLEEASDRFTVFDDVT